ncbi:MAG TPA: hypothetical protein VGE43_17195 [Acidimicrobiales bacterium]
MGITDPEVNRALHTRWRTTSAVAASIMLGSALVGLALAVGYDESPLGPALMLLGGLAEVMSFRATPRAVVPEERTAMARSALWTMAAILLFFGGPLLVG